MSFIAGHFSATYNPGSGAADIGGTERGFEHRDTHFHEDVISDAGGRAPVDGIQLGTMTEVTLDSIEYDKIEPAMYAQNTKGQPLTNVGKRLTDLAGVLILTANTATPAGNTTGFFKVRQYYKAIIISNIPVLLSAGLRKGPLTFRCFPDPSNSNKTFIDTVA